MDGVMKPYYEDESCVIYHADCRDILPHLPKMDLVWTSPPYAQQRDYGRRIDDWDALMIPAFRGVQLAEDGQILVNLGLVHRDGEVVTYWDAWVADMRSQGYRRFGWYVWDQGNGLPGDWNGRLSPSHEFIFHFNKSARKLNKTIPAKYAGSTGHGGGLRQKDGTIRPFSHHGKTQATHKIPDSVIRVNRQVFVGGIESKHPAVFPVNLSGDIIAAFTEPGDLVVDPFMGSGTTLVAATRLGRRAIGVEIEEKYCEIAVDRLRQYCLFPADEFSIPMNTTEAQMMLGARDLIAEEAFLELNR
jgi:DNA modification methylase